MTTSPAGSRQRIYSVVRRIPRGRVATYGQVALLAGLMGQARQVGYALSALDDRSRIPWHRVVNARGEVSLRRDGGPEAALQRLLLSREHVRFDARGRIRLDLFRWRPRPARRSRVRSLPRREPPPSVTSGDSSRREPG